MSCLTYLETFSFPALLKMLAVYPSWHHTTWSFKVSKLLENNKLKWNKTPKAFLQTQSEKHKLYLLYPDVLYQTALSNICAVIRWIINFLIFCIPIHCACKMPNIKQNVTAGILWKVRENSTSNIVTFGIYISTKRFAKCFTLFISRTVN